MIRRALEYILELKEPKMQEIHGEQYSDKELYRIGKHIPRADYIEMHTLTSLLDYIRGNVDTMAPRMIIDVKSPTKVELYSQLDENRNRETLVKVEARVPAFNFDTFMDQEKFCISLQSKFLDCLDRALVLKFAGTVESGTVAEYGDDGVTQKATVKTGIASKSDAVVPNPVALVPYRTFLEVEQPDSQFIFRMKADKYDGIQCAIFEADGGSWKNIATERIKSFLRDVLSDYGDKFTVIS